MKTKSLFIALCFPWLIFAQDHSWVKQTIYRSGQNTSGANSPSSTLPMSNITYLDGFGRPIQKIAHQQSEQNEKDIVKHIEYDNFGRQSVSYLPYSADQDNMAFVNNPIPNIWASTNNENPMSETTYEESPLSRPLKISAPGESWKANNGHEIRYSYTSNSTIDNVLLYENNSNKLIYNGKYNANELFKSVITDENGHNTETYKNTKGQLILKRQFVGSTTIDTYYVYDLYNNLSFVVPPAYNATNYIQYDQTIIDNLCYQYRYDDKNRLIEKKQPGKQWEYIVYDALNRIVATGPSYHPYGSDDNTLGWLYNQYDSLGRIAMTGWFSDSFGANNDNTLLRDALQSSYLGQIIHASKTSSTNYIDGIGVQYTIDNLPPGFMLLSVNYYDDYNFPNAPTNFSTPTQNNEINQQVFYNNDNHLPRGLPTGSWVRALTNQSDSTSGTLTTLLYDYRGRLVISLEKNHLNGYTNTQMLLNFDGSVGYSETIHKKSDNSSDLPILVKNIYTYTRQGRVETIYHQINANTPYKLAKYQYEPLGKLIVKNVGQLPDNNPFQKVNYTYNVRGWLTQINNVDNLVVDAHEVDLFAYKINYDTTEGNVPNTVAQFNGGISETYWKTATDNNLRKYSYKYDEIDRMLEAIYQKPGNNASLRNSYNETVTYNLNGNIDHITRNGNLDVVGQPFEIDNLNYIYQNDSNKLLTVDDSSGSNIGFRNVNTTPIDYDYDANGNLTKDQNKQIVSINYNHLNLPVKIDFTDGHSINYQYSAAGDKITKLVNRNSSIKRTDYLSGFQYFNGDLQFFPTAEGYVSVNRIDENNYAYNYVFNYIDHLGNIRLSYGYDSHVSQVKVLEENHYYPFGLKHTNYNSNIKAYGVENEGEQIEVALKTPFGEQGIATEYTNKYKFNGMEYQDELGLNLYDMDMRDYDPAIGRWTGIDPVTHFSQSPYCAMDNNPVFWSDPSGADGFRGDGNGGTIYTNAYGFSSTYGYNGYGSMGPDWHVAENSLFGPIDGSSGGLFGAFYNINERHKNLSVYGKTWKEGYVRPYIKSSSDPEGFEASDGKEVVVGRWVKTMSNREDLSNREDMTRTFDIQIRDTRNFFSKMARLPFANKTLFLMMVTDGAPFDLKAHGYAKQDIGTWSIYHNRSMRFDDYGNYNYGVAAKAYGMSLQMAIFGAGLNQISKGRGDFSNPAGFFDDPRDTAMIIEGYNRY